MDGVNLPAVGPEAKFIGMSVYFFASRTVFAALTKVLILAGGGGRGGQWACERGSELVHREGDVGGQWWRGREVTC